MITQRKTTLAQLAKELLEGRTFCTPAGREVGSIEKFHEDKLNGVGHICNMVASGYDGIRKVSIDASKENPPREKVKIILAKDMYLISKEISDPSLGIHLYAGDLPASFEDKIGDYALKKAETIKNFAIIPDCGWRHLRIEDKLGANIEHVSITPHYERWSQDNPTIFMRTGTWEPGYLVRDILKIMGVSVTGDSAAEVLREKSLKRMAGDAFAYSVAGAIDLVSLALRKSGVKQNFFDS